MTSSCLLRHKRRTHALQEDYSKVKSDNLTCHEKVYKNDKITKDVKSTGHATHELFAFSDETRDICNENKEYCKKIVTSSDAENAEEHSKESVNEDQDEDQFVSLTQQTNVKQENKKNENRVKNNPRIMNVSSHKK